MSIYRLSEKKASSAIRSKKVSVGVVGFGYIGSCIGAVLADKGFRTVGVDTNRKLIEMVNKGEIPFHEEGLAERVKKAVRKGTLSATDDFSVLTESDIIIMTVGTPLSEDYSANMSHIESASRSVAKYLCKGQLVILKSTIPPGTTEGSVRKILETSGLRAGRDFGLVFSPERLAEGRAIPELLSIPIVIGGIDEKSAKLAGAFWENALGVTTIILSSPKAAEMTKLADNLWIDLNIALGNEIALLSDKLGINALEVIRAANTLPKGTHQVNILFPGMGVGGYCLTKDPWFVHTIGKKHGLDLKTPVASRTVNDQMPGYTFSLIERALSAQGKTLKSSKVAVLGLSFKNNTGDCRFTPTKPVIELLQKSGCTLSVFDPLVREEDAKGVSNIPLSDSLSSAVRGADVVAFFTGHDAFKKFPLAKLRKLVGASCVLIDGRNMFGKSEIQQTRKLGFTYQGIGQS